MRRLMLALGLLLAVRGVQAQAPRVVLVELFTSEGCSSCPPADALLQKLSGTQVGGALVVALSEHVTYWNSLGWRDPWSQEQFTARQNGYGDRFKLGSVYTPQVVVNGAREVLGSDAAAVSKAVEQVPLAAAQLRIGLVAEEGKSLRVNYTYVGDGNDAELFAVIALDMVSSKVLRGENGGRTLTHVAVARSLIDLGKAVGGTLSVPLPGGLQGDRHLVLFAQEKGLGKVLGVDSRAFGATRNLSVVGQ